MTIQSSIAGVLPAGHHALGPARDSAGELDTPEFRLLAACCRWPPSPPRNVAIRTAAAGVTDWNQFLALVKRHRVGGLCHDSLSMAAPELPPTVAGVLDARGSAIARRNLALAAETVRLQRLIEAAGIPVLVLKGVALAQLAYGSLKIKHARDIDLLVPPDFAKTALNILAGDGYTIMHPAAELNAAQLHAVFRHARELRLGRASKNFSVELQWGMTDNPVLLKDVSACSPSQTVALADGLAVRTLAPDELFAYLCAHGAQHAWSRLKWLADLNAMLAANSAVIERLYASAQHRGVGICAGQALLLCNRLFNLSVPSDLADEIARGTRTRRLVTVAMTTLAEPYAEAQTGRGLAGRARVMLAQFLLADGWAFFLAQCRVASTRTLDIVDLPLPAPLHRLYPFLRLPLLLWRRVRSVLKAKPSG
jgi:Uncharacterised nucleotidyltransferase